jgi:hypothetical protein
MQRNCPACEESKSPTSIPLANRWEDKVEGVAGHDQVLNTASQTELQDVAHPHRTDLTEGRIQVASDNLSEESDASDAEGSEFGTMQASDRELDVDQIECKKS